MKVMAPTPQIEDQSVHNPLHGKPELYNMSGEHSSVRGSVLGNTIDNFGKFSLNSSKAMKQEVASKQKRSRSNKQPDYTFLPRDSTPGREHDEDGS
jgi:hypothetical protein